MLRQVSKVDTAARAAQIVRLRAERAAQTERLHAEEIEARDRWRRERDQRHATALKQFMAQVTEGVATEGQVWSDDGGTYAAGGYLHLVPREYSRQATWTYAMTAGNVTHYETGFRNGAAAYDAMMLRRADIATAAAQGVPVEEATRVREQDERQRALAAMESRARLIA